MKMKTKPIRKTPYLNLYNFDSDVAKDCPYVLTSPRSLEACQKAGCKPVELLRKNVQEYEEELELPSEEICKIYRAQEKERLAKLERCRTIRRMLINSSGKVRMKNYHPTIIGTDVHNKKQLSSQDIQLKEAKQSEIAYQQASEKNIKIHQSYISNPYSKRADTSDHLHCEELSLSEKIDDSTANTTTRALPVFIKEKQNPLFTGDPNGYVHPHRATHEISFLKCKNYSSSKSGAKFYSITSLSKSPSPSSLSTNTSKSSGKKKFYRHIDHNKEERIKSLSRSWPPISIHQTTCNNGIASVSGSFNDFSDDEKISSPIFCLPPKGKIFRLSSSCLSSDDLHLSEHDRRILESMALKKELERASELFAHEAHLLWEHDREQRVQLTNERAKRLKEFVVEKRQIENAENVRRLEETKRNLRKSQILLEKNIRDKEERAEKKKKIIEERKLKEVNEKSLAAAKHRAEIEAVHQQMELETAVWQKTLDRKQKEKLQRAENTRQQHREMYRRRVASANRVEELRHQERWQQVKEETEASLRELRRHCWERERRAKEKYEKLLQERDRQMKGHSLDRSIKFQHVRQLHDDLEHGFEKWQEQVLNLQYEATSRAEDKMHHQVESKRQRVGLENRARHHHHTILMNRISREEEARIQYIRQIIARKEEKMKRMAEERDIAIRESRLQAQATADLREHLRCTLSPETFDRKVARVALEARVTGRPPPGSPPATQSHIFLG